MAEAARLPLKLTDSRGAIGGDPKAPRPTNIKLARPVFPAEEDLSGMEGAIKEFACRARALSVTHRTSVEVGGDG